MPDKAIVIIPTYNEIENIVFLIEDIFNILPQADILVIDDNSPDGTAAAVEAISKKDSRVKLMKREGKLGLGSAYVAGFKYACSKDYEFILQMDADFSHQPKYLSQLLKEAESYPLVLGSRYVKGGAVLGWNIFRSALSRLGSLYARCILGLNVKDLTGGYKCFRRKALEKILATPINSEGYVFQIETTFKAYKMGFAIKEIPILFRNRSKGASKISKRIIFEAMLRVPALAWQGKSFIKKNT